MTLYHIVQQLILLWSWPNKEDTKKKIINLGSNIRAKTLCAFLLSNFFKKEKKLSRTPQNSFPMLKVKQINSIYATHNPLPLGSKKMVHFFIILLISNS
jgi:hypothetical protein